MEKSAFDKYIRKHTEKELEVPEGLDWENLNIPLPEPKKKRRRFLWLWFLFLGVVLGGVIVGLSTPWSNSDKNISLEKVDAKQQEIQKEKNESENVSNDETSYKAISNEKSSTPTIETEMSPVSPSSSKATLNLLPNNKAITNVSPNVNPYSKSKIISKVESEFKTEVKPSDVLVLKNVDENPSNIERVEEDEASVLSKEKKDEEFIAVQKIGGIAFSLLEIDRAPKEFDLIEMEKKDRANKLSLFLNYGINQTYNNYTSGVQSELLAEAENEAIGNSIQLGVKFPIKNGFFISTGFSYQKMHTTFIYSENLGTEINLQQRESTTRIKHICYNNYMEFVELNLGLGKEVHFGKRWGSQLTVSLNPSYQLKAEGRIFDEELSVFELENHQTVDRFFWSADLGVDLFFNIKNTRIVGGVDWKKSLSKIQLLENSDLHFQPQVWTLRLGIERMF